jgi:toxin FitB
MSYLLDTNVVSELVKPAPEPRVWQWLNATPDNMLYLSVITIGEIQRGIDRLSLSPRKTRYEQWLREEIIELYTDRILGIDLQTMQQWGRLMARLETKGRVLPMLDSLLAATALVHDLRLVTRNERHFVDIGVMTVNPWET